MTLAQKFLIDHNISDIVTNKHERDPEKLIYVSDVLDLWSEYNEKIQRTGKTVSPGR